MKLDEVFDENYYDFLQDELRRKEHDPYEDDPAEDTETSMEDFIIAKFEAGEITYDEAKTELRKRIDNDVEYKFWTMELAMAAELLDDDTQ